MEITLLKKQIAKSYLMTSNWCILTEGGDVDNYKLLEYLKFRRMSPGPYWFPITQTVELILHKQTKKPYVAIHTEQFDRTVTGEQRVIRNDLMKTTDYMTESDICAFISLAQYMIYDNIVKGNSDPEIGHKIKRTKEDAENFDFGFDCDLVISYSPRLKELISSPFVNSIKV